MSIYCPLAEALGIEANVSILDIPDFARENTIVPGIRKGIPHTEDTKKLMSEKRQGQTPMLGKKHSEETKQRMRETRKRYIDTDEGKKQFEHWQNAGRLSEKQKQVSRERCLIMNKNPDKIAKAAQSNRGKKRSPETRARMAEARKRYLQSLNNGV